MSKLFIDNKLGSFKIVKEQISDNDYLCVPYKKRKLFGWKRLIPGGFPTVYVTFEYLRNTYGQDVFGNTNIDFE